MTGSPTADDRLANARSGKAIGRFLPAIVFLFLALLTVVVWHRQVVHQRELLRHHTEDVGLQAMRRLETFVESRLTLVSVVAKRWSSHESGDYSRTRFEEFGRILLRAAPGFQAMRLLSPEGAEVWVLPQTAQGQIPQAASQLRALQRRARETGAAVLSRPTVVGRSSQFLAVLPLAREATFLGFMVVEFNIPSLIDDCFHDRIRAEFRFRLFEGNREIYRHPVGGTDPDHGIRTVHRVNVGDRHWILEMVPRRSHDIAYDAPGNLLVLALGLLLAAVVGFLTRQLGRRMSAYRAARDRVMDELKARMSAQEALRAAEAGYRSVFNAATDGILVLDDFGIVLEANPAAGDLLGFVGTSLVGVDVRTLLPADQVQIFSAFQRQLRQRGRVRLDAVAVREDGSSFDVEIRGTTYHHGDARRVLALLTDVSDRKRAERKLAQLSRSVLMAQESERARVARDLHDELGQILTALRLEIGVLQKRMAVTSTGNEESWQGVTQLVTASAQELRRVCQGLRPPLLDDLGLGPAVEQMVERYEEHSGVGVELELRLADPDPALKSEVALCAYRILQECLTNVGRHSQATRVSVSLIREDDALHLSVYDNGKGFVEERLAGGGAGITGMRERAHLVGGTLEIRSVPDEGTRITFRVPLAALPEPRTAAEPDAVIEEPPTEEPTTEEPMTTEGDEPSSSAEEVTP